MFYRIFTMVVCTLVVLGALGFAFLYFLACGMGMPGCGF